MKVDRTGFGIYFAVRANRLTNGLSMGSEFDLQSKGTVSSEYFLIQNVIKLPSLTNPNNLYK